MFQHTGWKIDEVQQYLDAFELQVLARPAPLVDVSTLQSAVDSFRADIDMTLEARVPEYKAPFSERGEDTVMVALFSISEIPPPPPRELGKMHRVREEDEARARNKECCEIKAARRASRAEEEVCQMRSGELAGWASSSRTVEIEGRTADSAVGAEATT